MTAQIFQINCSQGGVPKTPLRQADVTTLGLTTDKQNDTKYHGGPTRALCLFSLEHILALQAEGHPIYPGSIGENVTIAGLDWSTAVPGVELQLGDDVRIRITSYAVPCQTIQDSFLEHKFVRVAQKVNPGWSRMYAEVLTTGTLKIGDVVVMYPKKE